MDNHNEAKMHIIHTILNAIAVAALSTLSLVNLVMPIPISGHSKYKPKMHSGKITYHSKTINIVRIERVRIEDQNEIQIECPLWSEFEY